MALWKVQITKGFLIGIHSFKTKKNATTFIDARKNLDDGNEGDILGPWNQEKETPFEFVIWIKISYPDLYLHFNTTKNGGCHRIFRIELFVKSIGQKEAYDRKHFYKIRKHISDNEHLHDFWLL